MAREARISRFDVLSLNVKAIKSSLNTASFTKLNVVKEKQPDSKSYDLNSILPWVSSSSSQFAVSRNKISNELLKHCPNGFRLDDPNMNKSRFFVDYHRLHDPALKRYYSSAPIKNRLKKLEMINERNDAICTNKEFVEYIRYLDSIRAQNLANSLKLEVRHYSADYSQFIE